MEQKTGGRVFRNKFRWFFLLIKTVSMTRKNTRSWIPAQLGHGLSWITPKCWFGCTHKAPLLWNLKFVTAETNRYVKVSLAVPTFIGSVGRVVAWPAAFILTFSPLASRGGARNPINVCPLHLSTRPWRILLFVFVCSYSFLFICCYWPLQGSFQLTRDEIWPKKGFNWIEARV